MYENLDTFRIAGAMARHAGARQAIVAQNIAHADTPGYQAQQIAAFRDVYRGDTGLSLRVTHPGHIQVDHATAEARPVARGTSSPNGNTVSLEEELLASVAVSREHNRALTIYRHTMTVLRTSLGRG